MTWKQRRLLENINERKRKNLERLFMRKVYDALQSFYADFAAILRERGIDAVYMVLGKTAIDTRIGPVIRDLYLRVGLSYARYTYDQIQSSAREPKKSVKLPRIKGVRTTKLVGGQIDFNERWAQMILEYFRMYLIDKAVVPITIESKARIAQILKIGTDEGWTIERMAKELETDRLLMYRARLIVRTETAKAAYYGRRIGAQDSGFETTKEWIAARDSRTRHSHRDIDGEIIESNARYQVPIYRRKIIVGYEMLRGPGDPEASAGNVCNCRCTEGYAAKRDSNGRLMRKPTSRVSIIQPGNFNRPITTITI